MMERLDAYIMPRLARKSERQQHAVQQAEAAGRTNMAER